MKTLVLPTLVFACHFVAFQAHAEPPKATVAAANGVSVPVSRIPHTGESPQVVVPLRSQRAAAIEPARTARAVADLGIAKTLRAAQKANFPVDEKVIALVENRADEVAAADHFAKKRASGEWHADSFTPPAGPHGGEYRNLAQSIVAGRTRGIGSIDVSQAIDTAGWHVVFTERKFNDIADELAWAKSQGRDTTEVEGRLKEAATAFQNAKEFKKAILEAKANP